MQKVGLFEEFWVKFGHHPLQTRREYYDSLTIKQRRKLLHSFYSDGWFDLFVRNHLDKIMSRIKRCFGIDLIELRINAIRNRKVYLIEREIWDCIERLISEFDNFDTSLFVGGLVVSAWGKKKQFYVIKAARIGHWR